MDDSKKDSNWQDRLTDAAISGTKTVYGDVKDVAETIDINPLPAIIIASMIVLIIFMLFAIVSFHQENVTYMAGIALAGILISGIAWFVLHSKINSIIFMVYNPKVTAAKMALRS